MHYYSFNIADYRKDTHHLEPIEHYIYRFLIDSYYLNESPIAKETHSVLRRLRLGNEHLYMLENVLTDFFKLESDGWHHKRMDEAIDEYREQCEKNRVNGKKGGRPKKQQLREDKKPRKTQSVNFANPDKSETNPNHKPITNNQEPITKNHNKKQTKKNLDFDWQTSFDEFWGIYPRKVGKSSAKIKFKTKCKNEVLFAEIMQGLVDQIPSWNEKEPEFIPHATTWLNGERWNDEVISKKIFVDPMICAVKKIGEIL